MPTDGGANSISEVTRRAIFDWLSLEGVNWCGRLGEVPFLSRLFDLGSLPTTDGRFDDAAGDIWQHRVNNPTDWPDDWVYTDSRFALLDGPDEAFLRFLREMVHPIVRADVDEAGRLVGLFNDNLKGDGWELYADSSISGRPVYEARRVGVDGQRAIRSMSPLAEALDAEHLRQQIRRMDAAVESDPSLAIGTAKELVETICKGVLAQRGAPYDPNWDVPQLAKAAARSLDLIPESVPEAARGAEQIRILLGGLGSIAGRLAELRNLYGTGHGQSPERRGLQPRHARLAVGAAATLVTFLFETHLARPKQGS